MKIWINFYFFFVSQIKNHKSLKTEINIQTYIYILHVENNFQYIMIKELIKELLWKLSAQY